MNMPCDNAGRYEIGAVDSFLRVRNINVSAMLKLSSVYDQNVMNEGT
jgi:hypothetical protein